MFNIQKATDEELIKKILWFFPLYKQLQHVISVLEEEGSYPGIKSVDVNDNVLTVRYDTWYTGEYCVDGCVTFSVECLRMTPAELKAYAVAKKKEEEAQREAEEYAREKEERREQYLKLKEEFEPEGDEPCERERTRSDS